jgi:hypothetical protein
VVQKKRAKSPMKVAYLGLREVFLFLLTYSGLIVFAIPFMLLWRWLELLVEKT